MKRKAIIFGIKGTKLTFKEINLLKKHKPWGVILFSRNIKNIEQLKNLTKKIRNILKDKKYPIMVDQEGGTVSRLNAILDLSIFSQGYFGQIYKQDKKKFFIYYKVYINKICDILKYVGININTVPVLDVKRSKSHKIIGNRSFSSNPNIVKKIGNLCIDIYMKNKVGTVIKHIPGHGLSKEDSHFKIPTIKEKIENLKKIDFKPFEKSKSFFGMTAHIIYKEIDPDNTATHSKTLIHKIIRNNINFKGLLISDDLSMKALKYSLELNALKALRAGCNLVLHCNGNIREMSKLAKIIPTIDNFTKKKTSQFYKFLR
ncbi:MAG: beta-N-acetylhexosaminidase [Pelagibacterales bacterium]|nr:beta-N-acetylhexosaminidase [Pelagibacterales bacterium]